jgi:hypothetical protein
MRKPQYLIHGSASPGFPLDGAHLLGTTSGLAFDHKPGNGVAAGVFSTVCWRGISATRRAWCS